MKFKLLIYSIAFSLIASFANMITPITSAAVSFGATPIYSNTFTSGAGTFQFSTGNWNVSGGALNESASGNEHIALDGNAGWGYYSVSSSVTFGAGTDVSLIFWGKNDSNFYMFRPYFDDGQGPQAAVYSRVNGNYQLIGSSSSPLIPSGTHTFKVEAYGSNVRCYVDNTLLLALDVQKAYGGADDRYGKVGYRVSSGASASFDNLNVYAGTYNPPSDTRTGNGDIAPRQPAPAATMDYIDVITANKQTRMMIASLQGLVNRTQPRIYVRSFFNDVNDDYVDYSDSDERYRNILVSKGGVTFNAITTDPYSLMQKYMVSDNIAKAVIYDENWWGNNEKGGIINVVKTMSGVYNAVALTQTQYNALLARGISFTTVYDTRTMGWNTSYDAYSWAKTNLWSLSSKLVLAHESPNRQMTDDYFIANKVFVYYLQDYSDAGTTQKAKALFYDLLDDMPPLSGVFGVWGVDHGPNINGTTKYWADVALPYSNQDEGALLTATSGRGLYFQVTWQNNNLSVWSGTSRSGIGTNNTVTATRGNKNVYLNFILSDGDNLGVALRQRQVQFDDPQFGSHNLGYSFTNMLYDLAPLLLRDYFDKARATNTAYIVGSHGGVGYEKNDVFGMSYAPGATSTLWNKYVSWSGKYNGYAGMSTFWPINTNLGMNPNASLQSLSTITGIQTIFHGFDPTPSAMNPGNPDAAYNASIVSYGSGASKVNTFHNLSSPDTSPHSGYAAENNVIAGRVNSSTPSSTSPANYYMFVGVRGFDYDASRIPALFNAIVAQPRMQNLVNAGYGINLVRPDTFGAFYRQYQP